MSISRGDVLAGARKLMRTFASAPEPRRQARLLSRELAQSHDWTPSQVDQITAFNVWLDGLPPVGELRLGCESLLSKLS